MRLKTNYFNFVLRFIVFIGLFIGISAFGIKYFFLDEIETKNILGFLLLNVLFLLGLNNARIEPDFVEIKNNKLNIRKFPFYRLETIELKKIKGFSTSTKSYYSTSSNQEFIFSVYILYLPMKRKIHLNKYCFREFDSIKKNLLSFGINYLGSEKEKYKFIFRKYKFD